MTTSFNGNGQPKMKDAYDDLDDNYDTSSSSDSDAEKPREKIKIERSVDLATLKSTFSNPSALETTPRKDRELIEVEKGAYSSTKNKFEKGEAGSKTDDNALEPKIPQKIEIERTEADKKRVLRTFFQPSSANNTGVMDKADKCCDLCHKIVYHLEKLKTRTKTYHKQCFKCCECGKILSPEKFITKGGLLYCKFHGLQKIRPDVALTEEMAENMQISNETDDFEDEEYAVVKMPRALNSNVIRGGDTMTDDFEVIPNLQEKKKEWTEIAEQASKLEKKTEMETDLIQQGRVKSQMTKFTEGEINGHNENENGNEDMTTEEDYKNANLSRPKKKDEIKLDIDAKGLTSKFESGAMENLSPIQKDYESRQEELESLKTEGLSVRDRYKGQQDETLTQETRRKSIIEDLTSAATASIHQAKERFMKGETAFHESGTTPEKPKDLVNFSELGSVKEKFENPQSKKTDKTKDEDLSSKIPSSARCQELGSLKASFEAGGKKKFTEEELETRRKKHLEHEFKRLQIEKGIFNEKQRRDAEDEARSQRTDGDSIEEIKKCAELSSLKQRFEQGLVSSDQVSNLKQQIEAEQDMINPEAKSIKAKFESNAFANVQEANEEKRRNIQAEFENFKEEKQMMGQVEANDETPETPENPDSQNTELAQAAEYAQKMRAKWDKIQKKEAKKLQKAANLKQKSSTTLTGQMSGNMCLSCDKRVYIAESVECDNRLYHKTCFKCKQCGCSLRLETCGTGPDGIYCPVHYKFLFNDMTHAVQKGPPKIIPSYGTQILETPVHDLEVSDDKPISDEEKFERCWEERQT